MAVNNEKDLILGEYVLPYPVQRARLLESCDTLKSYLQDIHVSEKLSVLVTALIEAAVADAESLFSALMEQVHDMPKKQAVEIFRNAPNKTESLVPDSLLEDIRRVYRLSKAEERGFFYDEKKNRFTFNANAFTRHLTKRCHVRSTKDGRLFFYNLKGVYEELSEVSVGKIIRTVMHEGMWNSWKSFNENEVLKALQREAGTVDEMNTKRGYINVRNGMLDLTTFELRNHSPEYNSTVQLPLDYDAKARAPKFMQFMSDITLNDAELIGLHQELMGYLLTGETKAEKAVYFYGSGANGKSVLASIITELVGPQNVSSVPLSKFNDQFGMESMIGKSVNISAENEMGGKALKTENFKAIVSGDNITINVKYRPAISYRPYCRLIFLVNNLPDSSDVTNGYFRKLLIIPFPRTFVEGERNVALKEELLQELPGILNWAIEGLKRVKKNLYQFSDCHVVKECQRAYYAEQNPVTEFFEEHVMVKDGARTKQSDFYQVYTQWLHMQGIDDKGTKSRQVFWRYFKVILEAKNVPLNKKKVKGIIHFDGLELNGLNHITLPVFSGDFIPF